MAVRRGRGQPERLLILMRMLVLEELRNLNAANPFDLVADDEPLGVQLLKEVVHVALVVGEDLRLDPLGAVFQAAVAVG